MPFIGAQRRPLTARARPERSLWRRREFGLGGDKNASACDSWRKERLGLGEAERVCKTLLRLLDEKMYSDKSLKREEWRTGRCYPVRRPFRGFQTTP